ncbi:SapC family protein [Puniceibacterium sediminis]|uniref:SapC protein n=1 Tax=Puniceibacterium sediminis TaxID=1608407 RepID=A0A238Z9U6_9RHOB|nr:SapC family protein [Puniceibacterium sediminis]SNR79748.1 SapC protein [Puniceibacterium sediminis]
MANQLLFYKSAVPLSSEAHRDFSIRTDGTYGFADTVNSVPIVAAEFRPAASDCAIVFAGEGDSVFPVVILGLQDSENLYVDNDKSWNGRYVPAFIRRYPFVFAQGEDNKSFTLCIDTEYEGVNSNNEGERLFDSRGERTKYLEGVLDFTKDYQAQFVRTQALCKRLVDLDLLEPMQAQYRTPSGDSGRLNGFSAVNREKLKMLEAETLEKMLKTDELELLFVHLQSLNNLQPLAERVESKAD